MTTTWDARERLRWLGFLRWWAMVGAMGGTVVALALDWSFVSPPGLAAGVADTPLQLTPDGRLPTEQEMARWV